ASDVSIFLALKGIAQTGDECVAPGNTREPGGERSIDDRLDRIGQDRCGPQAYHQAYQLRECAQVSQRIEAGTAHGYVVHRCPHIFEALTDVSPRQARRGDMDTRSLCRQGLNQGATESYEGIGEAADQKKSHACLT